MKIIIYITDSVEVFWIQIQKNVYLWYVNVNEKYFPPITMSRVYALIKYMGGFILDLRQANERRRYCVTPSLTGWAQA